MINFPFGTNGKLIILGVPILKHITASVYFIPLLLYLNKIYVGIQINISLMTFF